MIIARLLLSRAGWLVWHHQLYSGLGADIVMESIALISPGRGFECNCLITPVMRSGTSAKSAANAEPTARLASRRCSEALFRWQLLDDVAPFCNGNDPE